MPDEINISFTREELRELSFTYRVTVDDHDTAQPLSAKSRQLAGSVLI